MPHNDKPCMDHEGMPWPSESAMCRHWGVSYSTYKGRTARGWTVEQALSVPAGDGRAPKVMPRKKLVKDHLGREFVSVGAMCRHWGISEKVYWSRKRICRWPLEKILTEPVRKPSEAANAKPVTDHEGNRFGSISELCRHWNIGLSTYRERRKRGWDMARALTGEKIEIETAPLACRDHTGKEYPSKNAMCAAWGVNRYCYDSRIALGWSQERALEGPAAVNAKPCLDHAGKRFPASCYMALYLGIPDYALHSKQDPAGLVPELAAKYWSGRDCAGYHIKSCVEFPWFLASGPDGRDVVLRFDQALDLYHCSDGFSPLPESKLKNPSVQTVKLIQWPWYLCLVDGVQYVLDYDALINAHVSSNYGLSPAAPRGKTPGTENLK